MLPTIYAFKIVTAETQKKLVQLVSLNLLKDGKTGIPKNNYFSAISKIQTKKKKKIGLRKYSN